jgi:hypothetical protein
LSGEASDKTRRASIDAGSGTRLRIAMVQRL